MYVYFLCDEQCCVFRALFRSTDAHIPEIFWLILYKVLTLNYTGVLLSHVDDCVTLVRIERGRKSGRRY